MVFVHGLSGNHKQMHYIAEHFKGKYRLLLIDVKGRGKSEQPQRPSSYLQHSEDICALLAHLHIKRPILVGFSMGAFILAQAATKLDVAKLILIDGAAHVSDHQRVRIEPSIARLNKTYASKEQYIEQLQAIYAQLRVTWSEPLAESAAYEIEQVGDTWQTIANANVIAEDYDSLYLFDGEAVFRAITCPIFIVHCEGTLDDAPLFLAEHFRDMLVYAKTIEKVTTTANHYTVICEPQRALFAQIEQFISTKQVQTCEK